VQLHHIDEDRSNPDPDNFAVLCLECHNEMQLRGGFGRHLNAAQVRRYRDEWNVAVSERLRTAGRHSARGEVIMGAPPAGAADLVERILAEAARSPKVGVRLVDAELEQEARRLLAGSGWGQGRHDWTLREAIDRLFELGVISSSVRTSLDVLEAMKTTLDAGRPAERDDVLRALDVGIMTYQALAIIPRERHYVVDATLAVYGDSGGTRPMPDLYGIRIRSVGPLPRLPREAIFLTRQAGYELGAEVTWLWGDEVLGPAWYVDAETGRYLQISSVEFRGHTLDVVA